LFEKGVQASGHSKGWESVLKKKNPNQRPVLRAGFMSQNRSRWPRDTGYWLSRGSVCFCQQQGMGEVQAGHAPPGRPAEASLDGALSNLIRLKMSLLMAGGSD